MIVTLERIEPEASHIHTFYFRPERPLHYTAGQFIELTLQHPNPDSRGTKHWFTLSSSPTQELLSITTKKAASQPSSFKQALHSLSLGDTLEMSEAMGDFVLPKLLQTKLVFVAGGIGLTPYLSIFKYLRDTHEDRDISFMYAVHSEDDIIGVDVFRDAGIHATILVAEPSAAWGGERGALTAERVTQLADIDDDTLVYVSGPEGLIESLQKDLQKRGVKPRQLVTDFFPGYTSF